MMIFKKAAKKEICLWTFTLMIVYAICVASFYYMSYDRNIVKSIIDTWKLLITLAVFYFIIVIKICFDKNERYIIQNNKIIFKFFNKTFNEIDIAAIDVIINCSSVNNYRYFLVIKESNEYPISIRLDLFNENGETLNEYLHEKNNIKEIVKVVDQMNFKA